MNLKELKELAWWHIDDNEENPTEIPSAILTRLINEAIKDISPKLNIVKSTTLTFTDGVASLPSDFLSVIEVLDDDTHLMQIDDIRDRADTDGYATQFYIPNNTQIYIYGTTLQGTATLWYNAYEAVLNDDTDIPLNIPQELHSAIAEYYVKAKHKQRDNKLYDSNQLMNLWEQVKLRAFAITFNNRTVEDDDLY